MKKKSMISKNLRRKSAVVAVSAVIASLAGMAPAYANIEPVAAGVAVVETADIAIDDAVIADVVTEGDDDIVSAEVLPGIILDEVAPEAVVTLPADLAPGVTDEPEAVVETETAEPDMCVVAGGPVMQAWEGLVWTSGDVYKTGDRVLHNGNIWERTMSTGKPSSTPPSAQSAWRLIGEFTPVVTTPDIEVPCVDLTVPRPLPTPEPLPDTVVDRPLPNGMCEVTVDGSPVFEVWEGLVWASGATYKTGDRVLHDGNIWVRTMSTGKPSSTPPSSQSAWRLEGAFTPEVSFPSVNISVPCVDLVVDRPMPTPEELPDTVPARPLPTPELCEVAVDGSPVFEVWEGLVWTSGDTYKTGDRVLHNGNIWQRTITTGKPSVTPPSSQSAWRLIGAFTPEVSFPSVNISVPCVDLVVDRPMPTPEELPDTVPARPMPTPDCDSEIWFAACEYMPGDRVSFLGQTYEFARESVTGVAEGNERPGFRNDGLWMEYGEHLTRAEPLVVDGQDFGTTFQAWTASWIYDVEDVVVNEGVVFRATLDEIREIEPVTNVSPLARAAYHWEPIGLFYTDVPEGNLPDVVITLPSDPITSTPIVNVVAGAPTAQHPATGVSNALPIAAVTTILVGAVSLILRRRQAAAL